jgi:predicted RNase H-like HicB family nuclease
MEHVYPAIFNANDDGSYTITYPDLPGCISEGKNLNDAMCMAQSALTQWLKYLADKEYVIPAATDIKNIDVSGTEFTTLIYANAKNTRAVKRTVSIPYWLDTKASEAGLSLSRVLQDALSERLK